MTKLDLIEEQMHRISALIECLDYRTDFELIDLLMSKYHKLIDDFRHECKLQTDMNDPHKLP